MFVSTGLVIVSDYVEASVLENVSVFDGFRRGAQMDGQIGSRDIHPNVFRDGDDGGLCSRELEVVTFARGQEWCCCHDCWKFEELLKTLSIQSYVEDELRAQRLQKRLWNCC